MKKKFFLPVFLLLLVSCNLLSAVDPNKKDAILTQVSGQLTSSPIVIETFAPPVLDTPTIALTDTETPVPTATITETPTLSPDDPRARLGNPTWKESFDKPNQNFYQNDDSQIRFVYEDGSLVMTAKNPNWVSWSLSYLKPKNYYLEATIRTESCTGDDRYGLVFRAPNTEDGYFFGFTCDGKYSLRVFSQKETLIPWTNHPAINSGPNQTNRIGVLAMNDRYVLYANGKILHETSDSTFINEGIFGGYIASASTANFTIRINEIAYWNQ